MISLLWTGQRTTKLQPIGKCPLNWQTVPSKVSCKVLTHGLIPILHMEGLGALSIAHFLCFVNSMIASKMNTLEKPTIEEEISLIDRGIRHQRELIRSHESDSKRTPYFLSPGQGLCEGANRRCEKCGLTCHAQR
jgi:hypothetical protein